MKKIRIVTVLAALGVIATCVPAAAAEDKAVVKRGLYLVTLGGCNDCHSPKLMTSQGPQPDPARLLSGHPANVQVAPVAPGMLSPDTWIAVTNGDFTAWAGLWGISFAANLTPDRPTGLGGWTADQFIQ